MSRPFPKCKAKQITFPCMADIKLDGWSVICDDGVVKLDGSLRKVNIDAPKIEERLYGELISGSGELNSNYNISLKNPCDQKVVWFDIDMPGDLISRREYLYRLVPTVVKSEYCENMNELLCFFDEVVADGYEGVVAKPIGGYLSVPRWFKVKKTQTWDLMYEGRTGNTMLLSDKSARVIRVKAPPEHINIGDIVEVEAQCLISTDFGNKKSLRNPVFKRVRHDKEEVDTL